MTKEFEKEYVKTLKECTNNFFDYYQQYKDGFYTKDYKDELYRQTMLEGMYALMTSAKLVVREFEEEGLED